MLRGIGRESNSMHSAKVNGTQNSQQATNHAYQLSQSNGQGSDAHVAVNSNSLSINGVNEKLLYKAGQPMRLNSDNSSNGYLVKSA